LGCPIGMETATVSGLLKSPSRPPSLVDEGGLMPDRLLNSTSKFMILRRAFCARLRI
jgi:hypothetical protein